MQILDKIQLSECLTGEIELDRELIRSCFEEIESRIADLKQALSNNDAAAWKASAHRSVGASATLGFLALADEFRTAEHKDNNNSEREATLLRIQKLIPTTQTALADIGLM
jgi:HPt (histidine-containing phosphotransfer) domain-containing protein